jgi:hypothetical protein
MYSISRPLIPRFFHTWAEGGLTGLHLVVERIKETFLPNNLLLLDSPKTRMVSSLHHGQQLVEHYGSLRMLFGGASSKIQFLELSLGGFEHFVNSKNENLFTLPLQAGFDASVHHFLSMLVLVQASFQSYEALAHMPSLELEAPAVALQPLPLQQSKPRTHLPTLLPKPATPPSGALSSPSSSTSASVAASLSTLSLPQQP